MIFLSHEPNASGKSEPTVDAAPNNYVSSMMIIVIPLSLGISMPSHLAMVIHSPSWRPCIMTMKMSGKVLSPEGITTQQYFLPRGAEKDSLADEADYKGTW